MANHQTRARPPARQDPSQNQDTGRLMGLRGTITITIERVESPRYDDNPYYVIVGDKQRYVVGDGWSTPEKASRVAVMHAAFERARAKLQLHGLGTECAAEFGRELGLKVELIKD